MNNFDINDPEAFAAYLTGTLIPDLRESGSDATADDFEDAVEFIEHLRSGPADLGQVIEAADIRCAQWQFVAAAGPHHAGESIGELHESSRTEARNLADSLRDAISNTRGFYS